MTPPDDHLAGLADRAVQAEAASLAQDAFTRIFRLMAEGDQAAAELGLSVIESRARDWAQQGGSTDANTLRLALLINGMDQWGVAWTQAFDLNALPGLTAVLGNLRNPLDAQAAARFEQQFDVIDAREDNAIDFKVALRRGIHLALWHAMVTIEEPVAAGLFTQRLGGLMLAVVTNMPVWGWRLLADSLAHIQIRLLQSNDISLLGQDNTAALFTALSQALPAETAAHMMAQSTQVVLAYQAAQRQVLEAQEKAQQEQQQQQQQQ